jgi:hypothetical protein
MASLRKDRVGTRRILFIDREGVRRTIRLGLSCSRRTWNLRGQGLAYPFPRRIPSHVAEA